MPRKGNGPAYKMIGVHVPQDVKAAFEHVAGEMDSTSSALGNTMIVEFLKEYDRIKAKGKLVWPIRFHLAYHPAPEVRFGDEEAGGSGAVPMVAEGSGREPPAAVTEKGGAGTVYKPTIKGRK